MLDFDDVKNILFEKNIDLEKVYSVLPDNVKPVGNDERNYSRINTLREPMSGIKETYNNALDAMNELPGLSPVIRIVQYNPVFIFSIEDSGRGLTQTEMENNLLSFNSQNQSESRNGVYSQGFKQSLSFSKITYVESIKENVKSWTICFKLKVSLHQLGEVYCYLVDENQKVFTEPYEEQDGYTGTKIQYFDYKKIDELKTVITSSGITPSHRFLSNYFCGIRKNIVVCDSRNLDEAHRITIKPINNFLIEQNQLKLLKIEDTNFTINIFYPTKEKHIDILKKYTEYNSINQVFFSLNGVFIKKQYLKDIFDNLGSLLNKIYINVEIKNNPAFFKELIITSREDFMETEEKNLFFQQVQELIINNKELANLNDQMSLQNDTEASKELTNMINDLINEDYEKNSEVPIATNNPEDPLVSAGQDETIFGEGKGGSSNGSSPIHQDETIKKLLVPSSKTFYKMSENFFLRTNVSKEENDKALTKIFFKCDKSAIEKISFVETTDGKIKYSVNFKNEYCNSAVQAIYSDGGKEIQSNIGQWSKRRMNGVQKVLKKITASIDFVNDSSLPIKIDLEKDGKNMKFLISKTYKFEDDNYDELWKGIITNDEKKKFLTNICYYLYLKKTDDESYFLPDDLDKIRRETQIIVKTCCLPSKLFSHAKEN